jgi:hypothetical protein
MKAFAKEHGRAVTSLRFFHPAGRRIDVHSDQQGGLA